jgi:hypothetical protein
MLDLMHRELHDDERRGMKAIGSVFPGNEERFPGIGRPLDGKEEN